MDHKNISDFEVAEKLTFHIENPCGALINGKEMNLRDYYIREAKNLWPTFTDPFAVSFLRYMIGEYS